MVPPATPKSEMQVGWVSPYLFFCHRSAPAPLGCTLLRPRQALGARRDGLGGQDGAEHRRGGPPPSAIVRGGRGGAEATDAGTPSWAKVASRLARMSAARSGDGVTGSSERASRRGCLVVLLCPRNKKKTARGAAGGRSRRPPPGRTWPTGCSRCSPCGRAGRGRTGGGGRDIINPPNPPAARLPSNSSR